MTTAFITKYALTSGIYKIDGELSGETFTQPGGRDGGGSYYPQFFHGNEWHLTKEEAIGRAEEMRIAKLKSLDKQMKKISALKFEIK